MLLKKHWPWLLWGVVTIGMTGLMARQFFGPDRRVMLPGPTTHGHYQIEMNCNACHTPWMGVKENACLDCHAAELAKANDSHPKSKFTDPRNADRLALVQADNCVACHREHVPDQTRAMGVTMPDDYCYLCHQQTLNDRPSHKEFAFDSCATAGCHNYHDNTALYESFLLKHADEPAVRNGAVRPQRDLLAALTASTGWKPRASLATNAADAPAQAAARTNIVHDWAGGAHARAGVNCSHCHAAPDPVARVGTWSDSIDHTACAGCHADEVAGFFGSRHGMRLPGGLSPMTPAMARLPMKPAAVHRELSCSSCHAPHSDNTRAAAVEACLSCHNDTHSLAYKNSSHYALWQAEESGDAPAGSGVSCATCHLPRETHKVGEHSVVRVQHNQNFNLRPNEKMIRSVCLECHGLAFSIDALADSALVQTNFAGRPSRHIDSIDLAVKRQAEIKKTKPSP